MPQGNEDVSSLLHRLAAIQIEEQRIITQLITATSANKLRRRPDIAPGDRIRITNKVNKKRGERITNADRLGTVTKVTKTRISFTTDSGTNTWRLPTNVQHIDSYNGNQSGGETTRR